MFRFKKSEETNRYTVNFDVAIQYTSLAFECLNFELQINDYAILSRLSVNAFVSYDVPAAGPATVAGRLAEAPPTAYDRTSTRPRQRRSLGSGCSLRECVAPLVLDLT